MNKVYDRKGTISIARINSKIHHVLIIKTSLSKARYPSLYKFGFQITIIIIRMVSFRKAVRIFFGASGIALILLAILYIVFVYYYLGPDLEQLFKKHGLNLEPIRLFLYAVTGCVIFIGILELLAYKFENRCLMCIVTYYSSLVYNTCCSRTHCFYNIIYHYMDW